MNQEYLNVQFNKLVNNLKKRQQSEAANRKFLKDAKANKLDGFLGGRMGPV